MSRIYEALQKARTEHEGSESAAFPMIEDFALSSSEQHSPLTEPNPRLARGPALTECAQPSWVPDKEKMPFYAGDSDSIGKEQFRTLRSRLYQIREQQKLSAIIISSALAAEGKSFTAANLAHAFALQSERRVLLLDCDLRRGSLATFFGAPSTPGLSELLRGECTLQEVLQSGNPDNLYLIPCGMRMQQPSELIASSRMVKLMEQLRARFDWIILDTPPAVLFSDASVLADLCDGVLLVIRAGSTPIHLAKRASMEFKKRSLLGTILNKSTDPTHDSSYYAYVGEEADPNAETRRY